MNQNLVFNPSFEDTVSCSVWNNSWPKLPCVGWYQSINSPDYFSYVYTNGCGSVPLPSTLLGFQYPHSGFAYAGFATSLFPNLINSKELVTGKLVDSLKSQHKYFVQLFLSSCNNCHISIDKIGAFFSIDSINPDSNYLFNLNPQIENNSGNILSDTMNWMEVSGFFIANGGEQFITLGCFRPDSSLKFDSIQSWLEPSAYYLLDDVSVIDCTATSLNELPELQINPWYNAIDKAIKINTTENNLSFTLINAMGKVVMQDNLVQNEISAAALSRGVYMLVVEDKRYRRRVFKVGVY
ncbi:MAG: T9SS type A sorting domain-containing protein [Bacteroidetes bacterium]|nr:T9SS type A sorting domain-containing protein [Bacteroidota bacterium]